MSNENTVSVKALRTFEGEEGFKTSASPAFEVSRQRFADLKANGLVEEVAAKKDSGEKMAADIENKQAPKPANKSAAKPDSK